MITPDYVVESYYYEYFEVDDAITNIISEEVIEDMKFELPMKGNVRISSPFGYRIHPIKKKYLLHAGVDLVSDITDIYNVYPGKVFRNYYSKSYGNVVFVDIGNDLYVVYAHLKNKSSLKVGSHVNAGDKIGVMGSTGESTAPHLHIGLLKGKYPNEEAIDITKYLYIENSKGEIVMTKQEISEWAKKHVASLKEKNIMSDERPQEFATREEVAAVTDRAIEYILNEIKKIV